MTQPIDVLLADDHELFRAGICALLESESLIRVVGEAATGKEAVEMAQELEPRVVVMDLSMPGGNGLEATRRLNALDLDCEILVLTMHAEEEYLVPVVEAGASGYLTKTSADNELVEAIRVAARGEVYLPSQATRLLLEEYKSSEEAKEHRDLSDLSPREREVLALTAEGFSSREIGEKLGISPKTVDTYRSRITSKLGLNHRSELVRFALRVGLLQDVTDPGGSTDSKGGDG